MKPYPQHVKNRAVTLYEAGFTFPLIREMLPGKPSLHSIWKWVRKSGALIPERRPRDVWLRKNRASARRAAHGYRWGRIRSVAEMGEFLGISGKRARWVLEQFGIRIRSRNERPPFGRRRYPATRVNPPRARGSDGRFMTSITTNQRLEK